MLDYVDIEPYLEPAYTIEEKCIRSASHDYNIDYFLLHAIREQEAGVNGKKNLNRDGTRDHGEFQINTVVVEDFKEFGISISDVTYDTCLNVYTAASHLFRKMKETGDIWRGVAWYHNKRSVYGTPYARKVYTRYSRMVKNFEGKLAEKLKNNQSTSYRSVQR